LGWKDVGLYVRQYHVTVMQSQRQSVTHLFSINKLFGKPLETLQIAVPVPFSYRVCVATLLHFRHTLLHYLGLRKQ
jgi:hypothetical protein